HDRLASGGRADCCARAGASAQGSGDFAAAAANGLRRAGIYPRELDALEMAKLPQSGRSPVQSLPAEARLKPGSSFEFQVAEDSKPEIVLRSASGPGKWRVIA